MLKSLILFIIWDWWPCRSTGKQKTTDQKRGRTSFHPLFLELPQGTAADDGWIMVRKDPEILDRDEWEVRQFDAERWSDERWSDEISRRWQIPAIQRLDQFSVSYFYFFFYPFFIRRTTLASRPAGDGRGCWTPIDYVPNQSTERSLR